MAEETRQENAVRSGDDVTCPNCGSHNVRCIPYPKVEFGIWFVLWLIVAFGGYMISVFITIAGIVFWSIALVIRLKQNKLAKTVHSDAVHHLRNRASMWQEAELYERGQR